MFLTYLLADKTLVAVTTIKFSHFVILTCGLRGCECNCFLFADRHFLSGLFYFIFYFFLYIYPADSQESDGGANT